MITRHTVLPLTLLVCLATSPLLAESGDTQLALEGYCPVCVTEMKQWVKGKPEITSVYDGREYRFPEKKAKAMFDADPAKYTPALGGDCVVCFDHMGKRMPGSVKFTARHKGRLYLFPAEEPKQEFLNAPKVFENVDLALGGKCAVCLAMGHDVPGKQEFTALHQGMRYLFPSAKEREAFLASPEKFAMKDAGAASAQGPASKSFVSVTGTSGCAACSYGVRPVGDKQSLGLAVDSADGRVYIVEGAEDEYPKLFENRFDKLTLQVDGDVIREQGRFTWIQPAQVKSIN